MIAGWRSFAKAQASAFLGGVFDYLLMVLLTEWCSIFYTYSILISGTAGAVVNFSLNRYWAFNATTEKKLVQLRRFVVVVAGSVLLKSSGTYLLTETAGFDYKISRLCIDALVSFGFNFTLQKYWVFKK